MLAIDVMNDGTSQYATRYPLKIPNRIPTIRLITRAAPIGTPFTVKLNPAISAQQNINRSDGEINSSCCDHERNCQR